MRQMTNAFRLLTLLIVITPQATAQTAPVLAPDFERHVAPILVRRCVECHQQSNRSGGLDLTSAVGVQSGGDSGPVIEVNQPNSSYLLHRVLSGEMPPASRGIPQPLPPQEQDVLKAWVDTGAKWPSGRTLDLYERTTDLRGGRDLWSLQPVQVVTVPDVAYPSGSKNPVDAFVMARLIEDGKVPADPANSAQLLRRMSIDTTGLMPGVEELQDFASNRSKETTGAIIDRLLASPQFGERWARHWLDVVRFAETSGYERDQPKPFAWKYRDWIVDAFNNDMPYDQFVTEQLAGDQIDGRSTSSLIATGFLRLGTWNDEPNDPEDYQYERLEDLVHSTSTAFLGLTVKCARCHDHKFDPIPQLDYYRIAAVFWPGPIAARDRKLLGGPGENELGESEILGWTDITSEPEPLHVLKNGERHHPLQIAQAGTLSFRPDTFREFQLKTASQGTLQSSTDRRRQLAEWIASPQNPLTARVIVNRIWMHYFGHGLVRSPDNFGFTGDRPTHPELLDWLAGELIRNQWRMKSIHRLILSSATYQQASHHRKEDEYNQTDAANRLLWKANRRRLDAEALRDCLLQASGKLDLRMGGPGFFPTVSPEALEGLSRKASAWTASSEAEQKRRSLYIFTQRSLLPPLMTTFDLCDTTLPCGQRDVSIVAPQALTLLNNNFTHQQAEALAVQIMADQKSDRDIVSAIWQSVLRREPNSTETRTAIEHVVRQRQRLTAVAAQQSVSANSDNSVIEESAAELLRNHLKQPGQVVLHLDAAQGAATDGNGRVAKWLDQSDQQHHASQSDPQQAPLYVPSSINGLPALHFDGHRRFMNIAGNVLPSDESTAFIVARDTHPNGNQADHREVLSNWSGREGNYGTSWFLGLTSGSLIRFSDALITTEALHEPESPFLLTASNGPNGVTLEQQNRSLVANASRLPPRRLDTAWVIGQQGNIDGEYWHGDIAEIIVFSRQLSEENRRTMRQLLIRKYSLTRLSDSSSGSQEHSPEELAWASLALVLMNSNEFMFVD